MLTADQILEGHGLTAKAGSITCSYATLRDAITEAMATGVENAKELFSADKRCPFCGRLAAGTHGNEKAFAGSHYNPGRDDDRLLKQIGRVFDAMKGGDWRTLNEIHSITKDPVASISAQLRHLRRPWHGSWIVDTESVGGGLYKYRMRMPDGCEITAKALDALRDKFPEVNANGDFVEPRTDEDFDV